MKLFLFYQLVAFSKLIQTIGAFFWRLKLKKVDRLAIVKGKKKFFVRYGTIAQVLYCSQPMIYFNRGFEHITLKKYQSMLFEGAVVFDIGANVGLFSILGSDLVGESGQIWSFEPSKETFEALKENLKLNKCENVIASPIALADSEGVVEMVISKDSVTKGFEEDAFKYMDLSSDKTGVEYSNLDIATKRTLDAFIEEHNIKRIDVIKIDVEGAELLVFKGMEKSFKNGFLPVIVMECSERWSKRFNNTVYDTLSYLGQFGYNFEQYENEQWVAFVANKGGLK